MKQTSRLARDKNSGFRPTPLAMYEMDAQLLQTLLDGWIDDAEGSVATLITGLTNVVLPEDHLVLALDRGSVRTVRQPGVFPGAIGNIVDAFEKWMLQASRAEEGGRRPSMRNLVKRSSQTLVAANAMFLPAKAGGGAIAVLKINAVLPVAEVFEADTTDLAILTNLAWGSSYKQIAAAMGFSIRTIEHRLERMKNRAGCATTSSLLATFAASRLGGVVSDCQDNIPHNDSRVEASHGPSTEPESAATG